MKLALILAAILLCAGTAHAQTGEAVVYATDDGLVTVRTPVVKIVREVYRVETVWTFDVIQTMRTEHHLFQYDQAEGWLYLDCDSGRLSWQFFSYGLTPRWTCTGVKIEGSWSDGQTMREPVDNIERAVRAFVCDVYRHPT